MKKAIPFFMLAYFLLQSNIVSANEYTYVQVWRDGMFDSTWRWMDPCDAGDDRSLYQNFSSFPTQNIDDMRMIYDPGTGVNLTNVNWDWFEPTFLSWHQQCSAYEGRWWMRYGTPQQTAGTACWEKNGLNNENFYRQSPRNTYWAFVTFRRNGGPTKRRWFIPYGESYTCY